MTTAQVILRCKIIIDKYGSPTIEDTEWVGHLNAAQYEVMNRVIPDQEGGSLNFEADANVLENFKPLIYPVTTIPVTGLITLTVLNGLIQAASGDNTCEVFRILNIAKADDTVIKFVRHNSLYTFKSNVFKAPADDFPWFTILATGYQIYPSIGTTVKLTIMKTPLILTNTGESLEFEDYVVDQIILQAVKLAGVGIRDTEVIQDTRLTGFQSAQ